jgi:hypothetical protein
MLKKTQKKRPPEQTSRARIVLEHTESSAKNFIEAFDTRPQSEWFFPSTCPYR